MARTPSDLRGTEPSWVRVLAFAALGVLASARLASAQCPDGTPPPCAGQAVRAPAPARNSIAVLPFANRSPDTADVYLAEGMTDEVGSHLTRVSRLQVKARGVVAAAWQRNPDPVGAARALRVAWYVHGTVRHAPPQLLVSVELVRPATGEEVWAMRFARPDADLFAAQAEVAESVAVVVGGRLSPGEHAVLATRPTRNNEAYRLYLYGNWLVSRRGEPETRRAVEAYTEAVRLDPRFAAAWGRLALARNVQFLWGWRGDMPLDSLLALAAAAARRAVGLDSLSSEAWMALAVTSANAGDIVASLPCLERSLRLDSLNAETLHWMASGHGILFRDHEAAAPLFRRALALDPGLRNTWRLLAVSTRDAGRLVEAEALLDTTLELGPWSPALDDRAYVRFVRGDAAGALADLAEAERLDSVPRAPERALYTVLLGDSAPARTELARMRARADSGQADLGVLARFSMALGLREEAIAALLRLRSRANPREPRCTPTATCSANIVTWQTLHDPIFAPLRGDPRFQWLWEETRPRGGPWLEGHR